MKTAVEQLMIDSFGEDFRMTVNDYQLNAFQKALEKEKEQIINAHINGQSEFDMLGYRGINETLSENYFNETYNNERIDTNNDRVY
jgi:hypothetical protein